MKYASETNRGSVGTTPVPEIVTPPLPIEIAPPFSSFSLSLSFSWSGTAPPFAWSAFSLSRLARWARRARSPVIQLAS